MSGILRVKDLNRGQVLKQGDKTELSYELYEGDGDTPNLASKPVKVVFLTPDFKQKATVSETTVGDDNVVSFTINGNLPNGKYYYEFVVGIEGSQQIYPSEHRQYFTVTPSSLESDINVIQMVGFEELSETIIERVQVDVDEILSQVEQVEATRKANEEARMMAESQREANELVRTEGMVKLENLVTTGDFSNSISGVISPKGDISHVNNELVYLANDGPSNIHQLMNVIKEHIFYIVANVKANSNLVEINISGVYATDKHSGSGDYETLSGVWKSNTTVGGYGFRVADKRYSDWDNIYVKGMVALDLTSIFGEGNEPSKEQMDTLMQHIGYFNGTTLIPQSAILAMISQKANRKQEEWITPTLLNGWTHYSGNPFKYYKDEFGNVHLQGRINPGGTVGGAIALFPTAYRPKEEKRVLSVDQGNNVNLSSLRTDGQLIIWQNPNNYMVFDGAHFRV